MKSHGHEVTYFYDKEIPKVGSNQTCLVVISQDFVLKKDESYSLQVFLKQCKYIEKKLVRHIQNNLSDFYFSSDDSEVF